jgi:hypothetical protein
MFRSLLGHHQVYCLCLGAELVFNMHAYSEYAYITRNTLGIIYFLVCWY